LEDFLEAFAGTFGVLFRKLWEECLETIGRAVWVTSVRIAKITAGRTF
jgi:hypothetical protein